MKTVTFDETKWTLVPIEPANCQLEYVAFNLCGKYGVEFVQGNEQFARDVYAQMIRFSPPP
jgi:hypothetical protein